jgi:imidazolonepropionase-like amidohydrolase
MIKLKLALLLLINCLALSAFCQTYITNVTIVDVVNQKLVPAQTVVIRNGIISNVQPSKKIKIPSGATVIDGKGKYLMPGLTDAHVHFFQSGGIYTRPDVIDLRKYYPYEKEIDWVHNHMEDFLQRYVKAGITSVIDVGSNYHFLQQRDSFENKTYAPRIFMTGPLLTSYEPLVFKNLKNEEPFMLVKTAEDGIKGVQAELPYHPDFIKIWYIVSRNKDSVEASAKEFEPVAKAIIDEAHKHHLKVAVHATQRITAQLAVESGCDYLVHGIDDEIVSDDFIKLLKSKNVIDCPTLIVEDGYFKTFGQNMHYSAYDVAISNPQQLASIQDLEHVDTVLTGFYKKRFNMPAMKNMFVHQDSVRMVNLKKMIDGGITIVAGTDAGNIGTQHASSLFDELKAMKESGLSNWQIIQSATINPTRILDKQDSLGSIAVGKKADLVLLNANPVEDLDNITHINLVVNKGKVIDVGEVVR